MNQSNQKIQAALNHLTVWLQEEILHQTEKANTLEELCQSMAERKPDHCDQVLETLHGQETRARSSELRRKGIFESLGSQWKVSSNLLTVGSIAERSGESGPRLLELRSDLKGAAERVALGAKKVSATARIHRSVILDVLNGIFDQTTGDPLEEQGHLLDAEA